MAIVDHLCEDVGRRARHLVRAGMLGRFASFYGLCGNYRLVRTLGQGANTAVAIRQELAPFLVEQSLAPATSMNIPKERLHDFARRIPKYTSLLLEDDGVPRAN